MSVIHQHRQQIVDKMLLENDNIQQPRHDFFLQSRPYRGEPPTVAGFLLYPDTPAKMETTSREAFCFRNVPQERDHLTQDTKQQLPSPPETIARQTRTGNSSSRDSEPDDKHPDPADMQSQYQKDFPPPSSCHRRRTPAHPQPDNIGINPSFRIDFSTIQRETFPGWPTMNPRLRQAKGRPNATAEQ